MMPSERFDWGGVHENKIRKNGETPEENSPDWSASLPVFSNLSDPLLK
jgi:hypothetical protein